MSNQEYRYSDSSLLTGDVRKQGLSDFDNQLQEKWDKLMELGHFRYESAILLTDGATGAHRTWTMQ